MCNKTGPFHQVFQFGRMLPSPVYLVFAFVTGQNVAVAELIDTLLLAIHFSLWA